MSEKICRDEQPRQRIKPAPKRAKTHIHAGSPSNKASAIGRRGPVDIDAGGKMVVSDEPARAIAITTGRRLMFFFRYVTPYTYDHLDGQSRLERDGEKVCTGFKSHATR